MTQLLSILLGFLPWIACGLISAPSFWRLDAAIIVALVLVPAHVRRRAEASLKSPQA